MAEDNQDSKKEEGLKSEGAILADLLNGTSDFRHDSMLNSFVQYLNQKLTGITQSRERYFNELRKYRYNYITSGIYDILSSDILGNDESAGFMVTVDDDEELSAELNELIKDIELPDLIAQIMPEVLHYGSYPLRPVLEDGVGLIGLIDDLEAKDVICVTESGGYPLFYFVNWSTMDADAIDYGKRQLVEYFGPDKIVNLTLDLSFIKLQVPEKITKQMKKKLQEAVGPDSYYAELIGNTIKLSSSLSFIWGALDKLKNTLMLDKIGTYRNLSSLLTPTVIGVPLPANNDIKSLKDVVQKYDEIINSSNLVVTDFDTLNFNMQDIASVKVVPISGDRANPTVMETGRGENQIDYEVIKNNLEAFLASLGIPAELFFGGMSSKDNLKANIRYAKKIKRIGRSLSKFVKYLMLLHIAYRYPERDVDIDNIKVTLKTTLNTDALENLEAQDLTVSSIQSMLGLLRDMSDNLLKDSNYQIDKSKLVDIVRGELEAIGSPYHSVFITKDANTEVTQVTGDLAESFVEEQTDNE